MSDHEERSLLRLAKLGDGLARAKLKRMKERVDPAWRLLAVERIDGVYLRLEDQQDLKSIRFRVKIQCDGSNGSSACRKVQYVQVDVPWDTWRDKCYREHVRRSMLLSVERILAQHRHIPRRFMNR